jgi:hypothetical protein
MKIVIASMPRICRSSVNGRKAERSRPCSRGAVMLAEADESTCIPQRAALIEAML